MFFSHHELTPVGFRNVPSVSVEKGATFGDIPTTLVSLGDLEIWGRTATTNDYTSLKSNYLPRCVFGCKDAQGRLVSIATFYESLMGCQIEEALQMQILNNSELFGLEGPSLLSRVLINGSPVLVAIPLIEGYDSEAYVIEGAENFTLENNLLVKEE